MARCHARAPSPRTEPPRARAARRRPRQRRPGFRAGKSGLSGPARAVAAREGAAGRAARGCETRARAREDRRADRTARAAPSVDPRGADPRAHVRQTLARLETRRARLKSSSASSERATAMDAARLPPSPRIGRHPRPIRAHRLYARRRLVHSSTRTTQARARPRIGRSPPPCGTRPSPEARRLTPATPHLPTAARGVLRHHRLHRGAATQPALPYGAVSPPDLPPRRLRRVDPPRRARGLPTRSPPARDDPRRRATLRRAVSRAHPPRPRRGRRSLSSRSQRPSDPEHRRAHRERPGEAAGAAPRTQRAASLAAGTAHARSSLRRLPRVVRGTKCGDGDGNRG